MYKWKWHRCHHAFRPVDEISLGKSLPWLKGPLSNDTQRWQWHLHLLLSPLIMHEILIIYRRTMTLLHDEFSMENLLKFVPSLHNYLFWSVQKLSFQLCWRFISICSSMLIMATHLIGFCIYFASHEWVERVTLLFPLPIIPKRWKSNLRLIPSIIICRRLSTNNIWLAFGFGTQLHIDTKLDKKNMLMFDGNILKFLANYLNFSQNWLSNRNRNLYFFVIKARKFKRFLILNLLFYGQNVYFYEGK